MAKRDEYDYEAHDAMHTLMRADEIRKDGKLMKRVQKRARKHASEMRERAASAESLARRGLISDKQMAKVKDLEKTKPLAKGNEGDDAGPTRTSAGINYR